MIDTAHAAWAADRAVGRGSLMIAADNATVAELNDRARSSRIAAGEVAETGVALRDGTTASVGDLVITRQNQRRVQTADGSWARNGDTWQIVATHPDGALTITGFARGHNGNGTTESLRLEPDYVAQHVQLGYAVTAHRAQGTTVDTCHVLATPGMTRESLYVAMTRGQYANRTYVSTGLDGGVEDHQATPADPVNPSEVLRRVLATEGTERSATEQHQQRYLDAGLPTVHSRQSPLAPRASQAAQHPATYGLSMQR